MIDIKELRKDKRPQSAWVVHALIDRLEAAEKDIAIKEEVIDSLAVVVKRLDAKCDAAEAEALEQARLNGMGGEREAALLAKLEAAEKDIAIKEEVIDSLAAVVKRLDAQCDAAEKERDALRAENERIDEAMESLLIRCDDSDSAMYGTLSTSFVRDTVRIARGAMEESK